MEIFLGDYPLHKVLDISLAGMWDDPRLVPVIMEDIKNTKIHQIFTIVVGDQLCYWFSVSIYRRKPK
jgi:hypothetical protein